jgi:hypothetical protein
MLYPIEQAARSFQKKEKSQISADGEDVWAIGLAGTTERG